MQVHRPARSESTRTEGSWSDQRCRRLRKRYLGTAVLHRNTALRGRPSSVRWVTSGTGASADSQGSGRLQCAPRHRRQRGAARRRGGHRKPRSPRRFGLWNTERGLTPRSRRGPTALHQAREAVRHIIGLAGLAQHRWSRLNSNVRPRMEPSAFIRHRDRNGMRRQTCASDVVKKARPSLQRSRPLAFAGGPPCPGP